MAEDMIRIKTGVAMRAIANSKREDVIEVDRAEWEAMDDAGREALLGEIADATLADEVEVWAYVDEEG